MITRRQWMGLTLGASAIGFNLEAVAPTPRKAGELTITLNSGELVLLSSLRGKVVALEFLLTTCPHCQKCSGVLQQMYQEFGSRGFQPIGAAINENARTLVPEFIYRLGLKYPVGVTPHEMAYEFLGYNMNDPKAGPMLMPQLCFIDRKGVVQVQYAGDNDFFKNEEVNMRNQIEAMLRGPVASGKAPHKK
jgi:peroxiredoxin